MDRGQQKVDMSLDEIIKLNRAEKKKDQNAKLSRGRGGASFRGAARGRGRGQGSGFNTRGRGSGFSGRGRGSGFSGRGRGLANSGRGRGRGGTFNVGVTRQQTAQQQGIRRGRGKGFVINRLNKTSLITIGTQRGRGRGQFRGRSRGQLQGRGRGQLQGRGRGRGGATTTNNGSASTMMIFTNKNRLSLQSVQQRGGLLSRQQRLNKGRQQAALLREKQQALKNLQQAQLNMQTVQQALQFQQSSRDAVVNQRRGLVTQGNQQGTRGRRKLLTSLKYQTAVPALTNTAPPARQLMHTSVTIANPAASRNKRRGWRKKPIPAQVAQTQEQFTIQVPNEMSQARSQPQESMILNQLKMLKPAVPTVYKFQKNVFAAPKTSLSLNDRFASTSSLAEEDASTSQADRQVYI